MGPLQRWLHLETARLAAWPDWAICYNLGYFWLFGRLLLKASGPTGQRSAERSRNGRRNCCCCLFHATLGIKHGRIFWHCPCRCDLFRSTWEKSGVDPIDRYRHQMLIWSGPTQTFDPIDKYQPCLCTTGSVKLLVFMMENRQHCNW